MNITLDLSKSQLSKLRNGHGIRIGPAMFGKGVEMIIDPMTFNNMMKKLERGKGAVISMSGGEIEQNKMEGTGLFAGAGKKSGKISRINKAHKWRDFSELELELIQTQMAQKPMLRAEVGMRVRCANKASAE
jgi:hypothetical protein